MTDKGNGSSEEGLKVIGAGWGRTGTSSLKKALEILGFDPAFHMFEIVHNPIRYIPLWRKVSNLPFPSDLDNFISKYSKPAYDTGKENEETKKARHELFKQIFSGYAATTDFPASAYFADILETFPNAKVILSTREFESWYRSATNTILKFHPHNNEIPLGLKLYRDLFPFGIAMKSLGNFNSVVPITDGKETIKTAYEEWITHVKRIVPKEKLLVIQVGKEGWKPLCDFLEVKNCPSIPFPHVNDEEEMLRIINYSTYLGLAWTFALVAALFFSVLAILRRLRSKKTKND